MAIDNTNHPDGFDGRALQEVPDCQEDARCCGIEAAHERSRVNSFEYCRVLQREDT
jgi:hypothetical protein